MTRRRGAATMSLEVRVMTRLATVTAAISTPLLVALVVASAATKPPPREVKHVNAPIAGVAMDGPRVAYVTDDDAIRVWNIRTGATTGLRPGSGRYMDNPSIPEVAIAGTRVAWITRSVVGNSQETWERLFARSLTGKTQRLATAFRTDGYSDDGTVELWDGAWLQGLVGSGHVLGLSRWTTRPNADRTGMTVSSARLSLIDPSRPALRTIVSGGSGIVSASADNGRIAVLRSDDSVGIYSSAGKLLLQIRPSSAEEIAYGGGRLVVLTDAKTLEVYDARTGALRHTWPIRTKATAAQAGNLEAYGRIGLYTVDPRFLSQRRHLIDLDTGKELVLPPTSHVWGAGGAAIGPLGLVYSVNTYRFGASTLQAGTLVFVPTAKVLAMLAA
jgi:WD40 repeat protein